MKGWKPKDLKSKSFANIQELFDKVMKRVNTFVDFRTKLVEESSSKRAGDELEQESIKKQKVAIDAIPLATKPPTIVDWKIHKEGKNNYYQIIRADGSSKMYMVFSLMLKSFDRKHLEDLYKLLWIHQTIKSLRKFQASLEYTKTASSLRLQLAPMCPAGIEPSTGASSKDFVISKNLIETTASPKYHNFLNLVSSESSVVVVSVDYRTAPEHPVPTCFEDSWEAIKWVARHANGNGPDPWLNQYPDFSQVFFAGDSAGGNISHHMAIRVGSENPPNGVKGIILLHPYFWGKDRIGSELSHPWKQLIEDLWMFAHPGTSGLDDPLFNPDKDPKVLDLGCSRVLVCVAGNDILKDRGFYYKDILSKIGWKGDIEVIEDKEEDHVFFLSNPSSDNTCKLRKRFCSFINKQN
ncbi:probable carboxylesterase 12 [Tanacetum coccineum]